MDEQREPAGGPVPTGRRPRPRTLLWLMIAIALVPVLGSVVRLAVEGWIPEGDDAMIARRSMSVLSTDPPLTGQPSTASSLFPGSDGAEALSASHPGPAQYWILAVPYRALGWSPVGLLVAVALVNGACAALVVWLPWRRLGAIGAVAGTVAVLVVAQRLGPFNMARPLNATAVVLPLLAGLVATWAVLCRDRLAVIPALACLSFAVQTHLGVLGVGSAALATVLVAGALGWWRDDERSPTWAVAVVATLVVAWGLVLAEQVTGDPGNLSGMLEVARAPVDRAGAGFGIPVVLDQVVRAVWPGSPPFPQVAVIGPIDRTWVAARGLAAAGALLGAAMLARRERDSVRSWLLVTLAAAASVAMVALSQGPSSVPVGAQYQVSWLTALTGLAWLTMVACGGPVLVRWFRHLRVGGTSRSRAPARAATRGAPAAALALVAVLVPTMGRSFDQEANDRTADLAAAVREAVPPGTYVVAASGNWAYLSTLDGLALDLLRRGDDVRLVRLGELPDEPQRRDLDLVAPTIVIDSLDGRPDGGELIARFGPVDAQRLWTKPLFEAVAAPGISLDLDEAGLADPLASDPNARPVLAAARRPDTPANRRQVVGRLLLAPSSLRLQLLEHLRFTGLDPYWDHRIAADLPPPYPETGLSAWLVPPG